jgi:[ribosomal protein S18]-alanine N-acetyltransferase
VTGYVLREMRVDDLPAVLEIELESYTMPWTESTFRGLLRRRDADLVVAEAAGRVVGYAVAWSVLDQAELGNVAVTAGQRRRGLGRILVEEILRRTAARGVREVFLEVRPSNPGAQRLYALLGFRLVGSRTNYYQQPTEDALVMRVELPAGHLETERREQ